MGALSRWRQRFDSLFSRLLLAQTGLVLVLGGVVGGLFYVERNVTIAVLYAELWAPELARAAGLSAGPAGPPSSALLRRSEAPESARWASPNAPRFAALRRELVARGVPVDEVRLSVAGPQTMVWLHVAPAGRPALWLGMAGELVAPEWSARTLLALLLASGLLVGVSWAFTRRLTRPLEQLRARMQSYTPGASPQVVAATGSPEIVAMAAAYGGLLGRLQRHERERAMLLAGVSHDLRSPLGRIRVAAELLPDSDGVPARKAAIVRNIDQANRLIESFLDFVRSAELACDETVDLADAARSVAAGFECPQGQLAVSAPAALWWPRANRLLVERLLANLVENALKHGRPPVQLSVAGDARQVCIEVEDAGDGIPPERVEALQEAFTRGDDSRATAGTGLGLAIVRQVALRLGGELVFERGTRGQRVRVRLPAPPEHPR